mmetsp:Transcript_34468/g.56100  ORF Transcript_34468/g.56100 Transcript_34468/m.56100 type:complete len:98 (+) Transcript_34468:16-309(+)
MPMPPLMCKGPQRSLLARSHAQCDVRAMNWDEGEECNGDISTKTKTNNGQVELHESGRLSGILCTRSCDKTVNCRVGGTGAKSVDSTREPLEGLRRI